MEPQAKRLLRIAGLEVAQFLWTEDINEAIGFAREIGYPVVVKVVSPDIIHKSDVNGVVAGVSDDAMLNDVFRKMTRIRGFQGIIVEEYIHGIELIIGMKVDQQFGPIIMLGMGGTAVELYKDVALRMAPLRQEDVESMLYSLKSYPLLYGYRGSDRINIKALTHMVLTFSGLVMECSERVESIDLNPVICNATRCVIADARILLARK